MEATREAVRSGRIPSAILLAADTSGKLSIAEAFGTSDADGKPMTLDSVMRMASCTKLLTAIAVVQASERGLLRLDEDVGTLVPELRDLKVMREGKDGVVELEPVQGGLTLTELLTHSSGFSYTFTSPLVTRWCSEHGMPDRTGPTVASNFAYPLTFAPGTAWNYGPGIDWAGRVLEAATGKPLDEWVREHISAPLGVADSISFFLQQQPEVKARVATTAVRDATSGQASHPRELPAWAAIDPDEAMGGGGARMSARAYFAVLRSLLLDDEKLLSHAGRALLMRPALTPAAQQSLTHVGQVLEVIKPHGLAGAEVHKSYALGGLTVLDDAKGPYGKGAWRRQGSLSWSGMPNHYWNVDPAAGVCQLICFHLDPWADPLCVELATRFEEETYAMAAGSI